MNASPIVKDEDGEWVANPIYDYPYQGEITDYPLTAEQWRNKAEELWKLLDDISTAINVRWRDNNIYHLLEVSWSIAERRHEILYSDGYKLYAPKPEKEDMG